MARTDFEKTLKVFKEKTGITLSEKDLAYCEIVYDAEGMMLEDRKRTKPTMQNYGIYVDRLDRGLGHSTMRSRPGVFAFTQFLIGIQECELTAKGKRPQVPDEPETVRELNNEINMVWKIIAKLAMKSQMQDIIINDYLKMCLQNRQNCLLINRLKDVIRKLGIDPNTITTGDVTLGPYRAIGQNANVYVDTKTGEIISAEEYHKRLELNSDPDVDEQ